MPSVWVLTIVPDFRISQSFIESSKVLNRSKAVINGRGNRVMFEALHDVDDKLTISSKHAGTTRYKITIWIIVEVALNGLTVK